MGIGKEMRSKIDANEYKQLTGNEFAIKGLKELVK